jgi:RNA polymerase sigma-70 factor (ECF subfamily)
MTPTTEAVWQELRAPLQQFFRRRLADETAADDLVQETFLRLHNHMDQLGHHERLVPWVYRIAQHILVDYYRQVHRLGANAPGLAETSAEAPASQANDNTEIGHWLTQMVQHLPEPYREAVQLVDLEGLTQQAASARLHLSVSGMKSRVQRGRAKLKQMLLRCCHLELDSHGNVVHYHPHTHCTHCQAS